MTQDMKQLVMSNGDGDRDGANFSLLQIMQVIGGIWLRTPLGTASFLGVTTPSLDASRSKPKKSCKHIKALHDDAVTPLVSVHLVDQSTRIPRSAVVLVSIQINNKHARVARVDMRR